MKLKNTVREFAVITFAMLIVSAAVYFFMVPSKIVMGSISGLALVFSQLTGISMSILTFFLNAILLVIGFLLIHLLRKKYYNFVKLHKFSICGSSVA